MNQIRGSHYPYFTNKETLVKSSRFFGLQTLHLWHSESTSVTLFVGLNVKLSILPSDPIPICVGLKAFDLNHHTNPLKSFGDTVLCTPKKCHELFELPLTKTTFFKCSSNNSKDNVFIHEWRHKFVNLPPWHYVTLCDTFFRYSAMISFRKSAFFLAVAWISVASVSIPPFLISSSYTPRWDQWRHQLEFIYLLLFFALITWPSLIWITIFF